MKEILADKSIPSHVRIAYSFGLLKPGYSLHDYMVEAVKGPPGQPGRSGYETILIWAVQGSGKSTRGLQFMKGLYADWDTVLKNVVFTPQEFIDLLENVPDDETVPGLFWDDILVHFPASKFKTDIKMYESIDSTFASIRTKANNIIASLPIIDRTAKNIKDNTTFEVFLGRNQLELVNRIFRLPGKRRMESNFFKVQLDHFKKFDLFEVPIHIWKKYWKRRVRLTNEALESLKAVTDMGEDPDYINIIDGARLYREGANRRLSPNTLQQMGSRGIIETKKFKGKLRVYRADILRLIDEELAGRKPKKPKK